MSCEQFREFVTRHVPHFSNVQIDNSANFSVTISGPDEAQTRWTAPNIRATSQRLVHKFATFFQKHCSMAERRSFQDHSRDHQLEHHDRGPWHGSDKVRVREQFRNEGMSAGGDISMMGLLDDGSDTRFVVSDKGWCGQQEQRR